MTTPYTSVQASGYNAPPHDTKSDTELMRQIAARNAWAIHKAEGSLVDSTGAPIGRNLETLAAAAAELGWFHRDPHGKTTLAINWGAVDADKLREQIASHGDTYWQNW